ncbi:Cupin 4 family protein [Burkholderia multivorans]
MSIKFTIEQSVFEAQYQEKKPVLMRRAASIDQFSWRDVNEIFERSDVISKDFKLSYNGIRPKEEYVERYLDVGTLRYRLIKPVVYDYLRKGATLISNKIRNEPKIYQFSRKIAEYTRRRVVSSAYVAFGTKDSYRSHWDTRDVFAIQIIGRKRWVLYEPSLELPLYTQQSRDYEHMYPCPTEVYMDVILEAGDVLYIPRGWWHNPLPLGEGTFHLALGTFPAYAIDYLSWVLSLMPDFLSARKALDSWEGDRDVIEGVARDVSEFIADEVNYRRFMGEFVGGLRVESPLAIEILGNDSSEAASNKMRFRLATHVPKHGLRDRYVLANGAKVNLSDQILPIIAAIANEPGVNVADLISRNPELDGEKLKGLIFDLCRQDVLEIIRD